ncbi:MAG: hypothetical protein C4346_15340 [Chloroflexota bacterium]
MAEHFNMLVIAWLFMVLIGGWLLVNALIDLGARRLREWLSSRWAPGRLRLHRRSSHDTASSPRDSSSSLPAA